MAPPSLRLLPAIQQYTATGSLGGAVAIGHSIDSRCPWYMLSVPHPGAISYFLDSDGAVWRILTIA